jgi:serine/threonine-protein kinase
MERPTRSLAGYEILRTIGVGGMGTVYLARGQGAAGAVALKVLNRDLAGNPQLEAMFLDEARIAALIRHPNVVGTLGVQRSGEHLFMVMEHVDGPSLQRVMDAVHARGERVPLAVVVRVVADALAGLHAAHELCGDDGQLLDVVHRDISPGNVLIGPDGTSRLIDFGVARARYRLSSSYTGQIKGKLTYMSPEQMRGDPLDRRADVYAAGVVLWQLLAGRRMFEETDALDVIHGVLCGELPDLRRVAPRVPEPIVRVCQRALASRPEDRWETAAALRDALEAAAAASGVSPASRRAVAAYVASAPLSGAARPAAAPLTAHTRVHASAGPESAAPTRRVSPRARRSLHALRLLGLGASGVLGSLLSLLVPLPGASGAQGAAGPGCPRAHRGLVASSVAVAITGTRSALGAP